MRRRKRRKRRKRKRYRVRHTSLRRRKWHPKSLADILFYNKPQLVSIKTIVIDVTQQAQIAKFTFGYVMECESIDEKDLLERETLFTRDGKVWTLLGRYRHGPMHHSMKWYPRDNTFPIGCKVKL